MTRKNTIARGGLIAALSLSLTGAFAQDIHFTQFSASPLIVNPAFTGNFSGRMRAAAIYRDQWRSVTVPFKTYAVSLDAPIVHDLTIDDYLAAGIQFYNDKAGDGNLTNTSILASVAYHKFLGGSNGGGGEGPNKSLSVGLQAGYSAKSVDISKLYFGDEFVNGIWQQGTSQEYPYLNNNVKYWTVNAGLAWAHAPSESFGYTIGLGANNLNQPKESFQKKQNSEVGLGLRYTAQIGAIWYTGEKFSLRPAVLYQSQATAYELVLGNEFHYIIGNPEVRSFASAVFLGAYYRNGDAAMLTVGFETKGLRFGVSYDYNTSALKDASKGNGGFEISLRYIAPDPLIFAHKMTYPCARF